MNLSKQDFLYEVTLRICSTLDANTALERTFDYLKNYFPVCECFFQMFDKNLCAIRNVAYINICEDLPPTARSVIPLSKELWEWSFDQTLPYKISKDSSDINARELASFVGVSENQDMVLPLRVGNDPVGVLVLRSCNNQEFSDTHMELINAIQGPLSIAMSNALAHEAVVRYRDLLIDENRFLQNELQKFSPQHIIGADSGLKTVLNMVRQVSPLKNTVLLLGETGVGKEVIADAIHHSSPRKNGPYVKVNCGAIPENLIDSELFGHEKGAFTGAVSQRKGRFERANGGTLFLDEIGELPLSAQVKLLRVIQFQEIERVGSSDIQKIDVRIIAATHRDLPEMVKNKQFREDLLFRLNVFPIVIPPLRKRMEDVHKLVQFFIDHKSKYMGISVPPALSSGALAKLEKYHWPGNVRELDNFVERELIRNPEGPLCFSELPVGEKPLPVKKACSLCKLDDAIAQHIEAVLTHSNGKVSGSGGAAEILGLNEATLRAKMKKLGLRFEKKIKATT